MKVKISHEINIPDNEVEGVIQDYQKGIFNHSALGAFNAQMRADIRRGYGRLEIVLS